MTILEILEAHLNWYFPDESSNETRCLCGQVISVGDGAQKLRMGEQAAFAHAAEVLDKHMQEREAAAKDEHRREWADHISEWHATVGAPICHVDAVVQALRSDHVPFGKDTSNGR